MGNRVKGRPKQKSIKAASHSKMGSKRKLSRMGKKQKKENAGLEATFIGRSKCLKMLQVTIKDFRRLCILKGIYPREPRGRVPGKKKGQTFYHIKDIRAIAHEPILEKFRDFRAFMKKVSVESKVLFSLSDTRESFVFLIFFPSSYSRFAEPLEEMKGTKQRERMLFALPIPYIILFANGILDLVMPFPT
jgi:hypothetical protein